jgi:hypothetical protein
MKFPFCGFDERSFEQAKRKAIAMMRLRYPNVHHDYRVFMDANGNYVSDVKDSVILFFLPPGPQIWPNGEPTGTMYAIDTAPMKLQIEPPDFEYEERPKFRSYFGFGNPFGAMPPFTSP